MPHGSASPGEFPWTCRIVEGGDFVAACAVVPEGSDNDVSSGTYRVITAAHRVYRRR